LDPKKNDTLEWMVQVQQRGSIMPAIFDLLYREYCRARLAEMRKQLLISPEGEEIPEVFCDAKNAVGDAAKDAVKDAVGASPAGGGETATRHEPLNH